MFDKSKVLKDLWKVYLTFEVRLICCQNWIKIRLHKNNKLMPYILAKIFEIMLLDYLFETKSINCARKHPGANQEIFEKRGRALHKALLLKMFMTVLPEIYKIFINILSLSDIKGLPEHPTCWSRHCTMIWSSFELMTSRLKMPNLWAQIAQCSDHFRGIKLICSESQNSYLSIKSKILPKVCY